MPKRQPKCDVPGCGQLRHRWQRLCDRCFRALPHHLRTRIKDCHRLQLKREWRAACREAGKHMQPILAGTAPTPRIAPERAYELQARLLGERS